jgi:uroporphyrinogen decarboxylase
VQHAQAGLLTPEEFLGWSSPSDRAVLESAAGLWCNMLHLHGEDVYFDAVRDYPVQIINWHDRDTLPTLAEARHRYKGVLCGGLGRETLTFGTPEKIRLEAGDAIADTQNRRLLLSTGCVIPIITPHGNIMAARQAVSGDLRVGG